MKYMTQEIMQKHRTEAAQQQKKTTTGVFQFSLSTDVRTGGRLHPVGVMV